MLCATRSEENNGTGDKHACECETKFGSGERIATVGSIFERKAEDAVGGKKEYQIENPTGTFYSFFVNMNNKMMLNQELIKEYDVETLSVRLKDLLRKEYRKVANTDKNGFLAYL